MSDDPFRPCTAFCGTAQLATGSLVEVASGVKAALDEQPHASVLVFDDATGAVVDLDLRGTTGEIVARLAARTASPAESEPRGRGRPKLGVVAREVTLLPRHWAWLAAQPGGASQALRRIVDEARRRDDGQAQTKAAREATYRFLAALAGDLPDFEEAIRSLFAGAGEDFARRMGAWPPDVRRYALKLAGDMRAPAPRRGSDKTPD